ncbi:MAG: TetR/AcrR family transcriptional regulator, partial [Actinomycetota bacterium]|nr:TetR/AcrR family transcriptional regulator [Actinomycetota bacterium]
PLRIATAEVFESWIDGLTAYLMLGGEIERDRSRELAIEIIAILEGAFVLSRALKSPEPMHVAGTNAVARVQAALLG